jgi:hypothetical protein
MTPTSKWSIYIVEYSSFLSGKDNDAIDSSFPDDRRWLGTGLELDSFLGESDTRQNQLVLGDMKGSFNCNGVLEHASRS